MAPESASEPLLQEVVAALEAIAPLGLAEPWDNVGMLVRPGVPHTRLASLLLTVDLTERVLDEALERGAGLVVAYHPLLFDPIRRIDPEDSRVGLAVRCIENGLCVYSPHTALDAVPGGVADWMLDGLGKGPRSALRAHEGEPEVAGAGAGREVLLDEACTPDEVLARVKDHLGLEHLRVAWSARHRRADAEIASVAACPGSGGELFRERSARSCLPDLFWTGEMRHHDVLELNARGSSVILCDHTNTERGYLPLLRARLLESIAGEIEITVAASDTDPLSVV